MSDLDQILITDELTRRPARAPDCEAENRALVTLARAIADAPDSVLQRLAEVAIELTGAASAGVSLIEEHDGRPVFRWHAIAGAYAEHLMGMAPRDFSPCGLVVDRGRPELLRYPGRHFTYLDQATPRIVESLLIPFQVNRQPVGTVWLLSHDEGRRFDAEDVRLMTHLGDFCAAALSVTRSRQEVARQAAARAALEARARDAERDAEARFHTLVQNVFDYAIFMLDAEGRVTAWNEGAARVKGYAADEIIGRHFSIFFTAEDRRLGKPEFEKGMAEAHGRYEGEGWRVRKDGSVFWGNEILTAVRDETGKLVGFTKIARDLSERKVMEDALRRSEERHRLLVETIHDHGVFTLGPDGRVASWNPGAERIFGYAPEEIINQPSAVMFTPEDRAAGEVEKELATAAADGRASDDRWQVRKGGGRFWASGVTSAMRDSAGRLLGFNKVLRDMTADKLADEQRERLFEQERIARLEAERAMTMRDEFLAVVSHELRTPLTAILLWSRLLETGAVAEPEQAAAVRTIRQSADAQVRLIEDLLDISRITSGKMRLNVRDTDLSVVVRAAVEAVLPMAEASGVGIEVTSAGAASGVRADPDRLQQVVWNLVNNAVKFTGHGGRVTVRVERRDGVARAVVSDTGRGIEPDFLPQVFDLFRQGEATLTRRHGGLGLGLSISRKLVELHGGTIRADSAGPGKGATFTVELPLAKARDDAPPTGRNAAPAKPPPFAPGPVLKGARVLFVEDEADTRAVVQWLLERCGADVTAVGSVPAALDAYQSAAAAAGDSAAGFDVLVSDLAMPGQDGYELLRRIRLLESAGVARGPMPALALTARVREQGQDRAIEAGFQEYVPKPVEPDVLVAAVVRLAKNGRPS